MRRTNPDAERPFRAPFGAVVPILGIVLCLLLMFSLPGENWLRLFVWLLIGFVIYFGYGRHHSVLAKVNAAQDAGRAGGALATTAAAQESFSPLRAGALFAPRVKRRSGLARPRSLAARGSSSRDPAARLAAGSLAVPFAALRASVSRRRCARWGPAASGAMAASPEGRIGMPPTHYVGGPAEAERSGEANECGRNSTLRGVGGQNRPAGAGRFRRSVRVPSGRSGGVETPALSAAKGTARLRPPLRPARSHAQAGRRAALDAPPERHGRSPLGKTETGLTQWRRPNRPTRATGKQAAPRSGKEAATVTGPL